MGEIIKPATSNFTPFMSYLLYKLFVSSSVRRTCLPNGSNLTSLSSRSSPKILTRFSICFQLASAGGTLSINLIHFENEKSLKPDGSCCDVDGYGKCTTCQYYFIICISETGSQNCSIERIWTNTLAYGEYNVFGDHFYEVPSGEKVQNPIILPISKWSVSEAIFILSPSR